ncbi:MAG: hypothetical protein EBR52_03615 [Microbacteriaceae bacterium]|nr:hypothetical protein [Microbacteriaceae bacterium]
MHAARTVTRVGFVSARHDFLDSETGAGSMLALAIIATCVTLIGVLLPFVGFVVVHERAQAVTDRAALSAASALHGAIPGDPCSRASDAIGETRQNSWTCTVAGGDAFVTMDVSFGPLRLFVRSRAGL